MASKSRQQSLFGFEENSSAGADSSASPNHAGSGESAEPAVAVNHSSLEGKKVYVIDAFSLIFQVFHVMPLEMTSPSGEPTGAVHGFVRDMADLLQRKQPDYLFCAFDLSGGTFRHDLFPEYKALRDEMPVELRPQIGKIRQMLGAMNIPIVDSAGYEADDILATIAREVDARGGQCYLVTADKDCRQLITERVCLYNIRKDAEYRQEELAADWGVRPGQVVDFQAMVGDKVDNVPGVPLIGPKTAAELLAKYGTLEEVLANASDIKGKKGANLREFAEQALLSQTLVRLCANVPVEIPWAHGHVGGMHTKELGELIEEFGFRTLGERVLGMTVASAPAEWESNYELIESLERLGELVEMLSAKSHIAFDTETTSTNPRAAKLVGISVAWDVGQAAYIPLWTPEGDVQLPLEPALALLRPLLENPAVGKIGQNLKYDMVVMRSAGVELAGLQFDTMLADYLLDSGRQTHNLDDLAKRFLNHNTVKIKELIGSGKNQKFMHEVPVATVAHYAAEDADVPYRLHTILAERLAAEELNDLFTQLEMPLIEVLVDMEYTGMRVDVDRLNALSETYGERLMHLEQEIHEIAGRRFNIASPKQLAELLFTELNLPVIKRTKTGPSTDASVLEELAKQHELPAKIVEYRQYAKLKGTYLDALPLLVHPLTGRIHTSFNQVVAATGRLSSNDPNLQNIPIRTQAGREIRSAFTAGDPTWKLLAADYSQIELRVLAHYCGDANLQEAFAADQDIHARVASEVNGVPLEEVTSEMRRRAKAVNFGIIYGQTPFGLAKAIDITKEEAADFIDAYFERYPGVEKFINETLADCLTNGYVKTILGRRRAITGVRDPAKSAASSNSQNFRNLAERTAVNTVIQGSAADIIKRAMLAVQKRLKAESHPARMLLQIHDELVFETPEDTIDSLASIVREEMSGAYQLRVPLKVDMETGWNWAECEEY